MNGLQEFLHILQHSFNNLLPIVVVAAFFPAAVMRAVPDGLTAMVSGHMSCTIRKAAGRPDR